MASRHISVLDEKESPWHIFFREYFEDTPSSVVDSVYETRGAAHFFDRKRVLDVAFVNEALVSLPLAQAIKVHRQTVPSFRLFQIGRALGKFQLAFDGAWTEPPSLTQFQRELVQRLPLPEKVSVLVVDDEPEIGTMIRDYLDGRRDPAFVVMQAENGRRALDFLRDQRPDVIVLDIKMPEMRGDEFYKEIKRLGLGIPVIVFFDAISFDEMAEIKKAGQPAVVEKGGHESAMPEMMALIKKMVYFG